MQAMTAAAARIRLGRPTPRRCTCRAAGPSSTSTSTTSSSTTSTTTHSSSSSSSSSPAVHAARQLHDIVKELALTNGRVALLIEPAVLPLVQRLASPSGHASSSSIASYAGSPQAMAVLVELLGGHVAADTAAAMAAAAAAPAVLSQREELCDLLQDSSVRAALKHARHHSGNTAPAREKEQRALQLLQRELQDDPATAQLVGCLAAAAGEQEQEHWQQQRPLVPQQQQQHAARQEAPLKQQHQHQAAAMPRVRRPALARR